MAVRASAFVGAPQVDSPVTRKQASLFWAACSMKDRRFSRLHELLKWDAWLYEAAIKVLRLVYPCVSSQEEYARAVAEDLRQEFCQNAVRLGAESFRGVDLQELKQSVIRTAVGMALEPIWRAKSRMSFRTQSLENEQVGTVSRLVEVFEENVFWQWVLIVRCLPALRGMRSKSVVRALRRHISDKKWLDAVHRAFKSGSITYLDASECRFSYDRELAWLLCDIALSPLDEWMITRGVSVPGNQVEARLAGEVSRCHYFRMGPEVVCLMNGSLAQAQVVERDVVTFLGSELGLCGAESSICSASEGFEFRGMELVREGHAQGAGVILRMREDQIAKYRSAVRALTSATHMGSYGIDVVVLSLNRVIREWSRSLEPCGNRGMLETLDAWTERRVFRFLLRLYPNSSHKSITRRFYGCMKESSLSDQKISERRGLRVEIGEDSAVFFLDKLTRFETFIIRGAYTEHSDFGKYHPQCAICSGVKGLRVYLSDKRKVECVFEDFIILCSTCLRSIESCSNHRDSGEPDAVKVARPVRRGVPENTVQF